MAQALVAKEGKITNVVTMSVERCRALEDPARASILHILSHRPMSTEGLVRELNRNGFVKAVTTIRHHVDILRDCGLIEVVRLREVRGAVEKYYAPTIKFLGFEDSFSVEGYNALIGETARKLLKIMVSIAQRYGNKIKSAPGLSCRYCSIHHGREYILFEIMNRAIAGIVQSKEFLEVQKLLESAPKMEVVMNDADTPSSHARALSSYGADAEQTAMKEKKDNVTGRKSYGGGYSKSRTPRQRKEPGRDDTNGKGQARTSHRKTSARSSTR